MTRYAIVGSRDYSSPDLVKAFVDQLRDNAVVVSSGARGVDTVAVEAAEARGLEVQAGFKSPALRPVFGRSRCRLGPS